MKPDSTTKMQTVLYIEPDGTIHGILNEAMPLDSLGAVTVRRASHVWPTHAVKRTAFRVLRFFFGERGRVAEWCRSWRGPWEVRFVDPLNNNRPGAVVFSHQSRRVCIAWEIEQLNRKLSGN